MTRLVDGLSEIAQLESGKTVMVKKNVDLSAVVEKVAANLKVSFQEKNIDLNINAKEPLTIKADPDRIYQIIYNLLHNALKYTPVGGSAGVSLYRQGSNAVIIISDSGIGISQEDLPLIFERFYRARNVTNIQVTGLGLNIVKKYVELMEGKINYKSVLNQGSTFTVTLPAKYQAE